MDLLLRNDIAEHKLYPEKHGKIRRISNAEIMCSNLVRISFTLILLTHKINVLPTSKKIIMQKHTIFISSAHIIHNTLFWFRVKKLYANKCKSNGPPKVYRRRCWKWKLNIKKRLCKKNFWSQKLIKLPF